MTVSATNLHAQSVMTNAGTNILRDIREDAGLGRESLY